MYLAPPRGETLPYLSRQELSVAPTALRHVQLPAKAETDAQLHYPFSRLERDAVEIASRGYRKARVAASDKWPTLDWLKMYWDETRQEKGRKLIDRIVEEASNTTGLENRTMASIRSFLLDLVQGHDTVISARIAPKRAPNFEASLLSRSLGYSRAFQIRDQSYATLSPSLAFGDLSGEVNTVAFHPNGNTFAAGTICFTDRHSLEYNNSGSLVIGNVDDNCLAKVADHWLPQEGPICNPVLTDRSWRTPGKELHYTVSSVGFSNAGILYSAGRDGKLLAYDAVDRRIISEYTDEPGGCPPVECMSVADVDNIVAIGRRTAKDSVVVLRHTPEITGFTSIAFGLSKAELSNDMILSPTCLGLGFGGFSNLLVAGFAANRKSDESEEDPSTEGMGQLCLFDIAAQRQLEVIPYSGAVFATAWSPCYARFFATACAASAHSIYSNKGVKSVVRIYHPMQTWRKISELDCYAQDVNELTIW
jgi:hypothetical protein